MSQSSYGEKLTADGIPLASRAAVAGALLGKLTVGNAGGRSVLIPYYLSPTMASEVPSWDRFAADPGPRSQEKIGVLSVETELIQAERKRLAELGIDSRVAVAWAVGQSVLVGDLPEWDDEDEIPHDTFGMRVGPEGLVVAPVLRLPGNHVRMHETGFTITQQAMALDSVPPTMPIY